MYDKTIVQPIELSFNSVYSCLFSSGDVSFLQPLCLQIGILGFRLYNIYKYIFIAWRTYIVRKYFDKCARWVSGEILRGSQKQILLDFMDRCPVNWDSSGHED